MTLIGSDGGRAEESSAGGRDGFSPTTRGRIQATADFDRFSRGSRRVGRRGHREIAAREIRDDLELEPAPERQTQIQLDRLARGLDDSTAIAFPFERKRTALSVENSRSELRELDLDGLAVATRTGESGADQKRDYDASNPPHGHRVARSRSGFRACRRISAEIIHLKNPPHWAGSKGSRLRAQVR